MCGPFFSIEARVLAFFFLFRLCLVHYQNQVDWTSSNITPLFKKGSKHSPSNYRPISLTSIVVKCLEHLIHHKISTFLTDHQKLSPHQHGFRFGHSYQTQLLESVHQWAKSLDQRQSSNVIFLDFVKAFDSVPHKRLLLKLDHIGIRGKYWK